MKPNIFILKGLNVVMRLILHGGAGEWEKDNHPEVLKGMESALVAGWDVLKNGGSALSAVEVATIALEDHPLFDAGVGSFLNDMGEVEMDALITDGRKRDFGAIAGVMQVKNPITLARLIMENSQHRFFIADGAEKLALEYGLQLVPNLTFVTEDEFKDFKSRLAKQSPIPPARGTVGAVAIDSEGNTASATSTGGSPHKKKGRVGDVPIYGAGGYSDNRYGGASSTGIGENIMRHVLSKQVIDRVANGITATEAAIKAVADVADNIPNPEVGVIALDQAGNIGAAHTTAFMPVAWVDADGVFHSAMSDHFFKK